MRWVAATLFLIPVLGLPFQLVSWPGDLIVTLLMWLLAWLAWRRPLWGLLGVAATLPMATPLAVITGTALGASQVAEALALSFLGGAGLARARASHVPLALTRPAVLLLSVITAGTLVEARFVQVAHETGSAYVLGLFRHFFMSWFAESGSYRVWHLLAGWAESVALALTCGHLAGQAELRRSIRVLLYAMTGAASLSVVRVTEVAWRGAEPWMEAFWRLSDLRVYPLHGDLIAGAAFLGAGAVAAWVLFMRQNPLWMLAAVVLSVSMWLTGARTALATTAAALLVSLWARWTTRRLVPAVPAPSEVPEPFIPTIPDDSAMLESAAPERTPVDWWKWVKLTSAVVVVAALMAATGFAVREAFTRFQSGRWRPHVVMSALDDRLDYKAVSWLIIEDHPIFGVGPGRYQEASLDQSPPELRQLYPYGFLQFGENAHDNYLQILAEFGPVGLLAFLWLLARLLAPVVTRARREGPVEAWALGCGVLMFLLMGLSSHPLLISQVSLWVFLAMGLASAAASEAPGVSATAGWRRGVLVGVVLVFLVSVPWRASDRIATGNLEHAAVGASSWQQDGDFQYRLASDGSRWFVPAGAGAVSVEMQWENTPPEACVVWVAFGGVVSDQLRPETSRRTFRIAVPSEGRARRFAELTLTVPDGCPALRVGRFSEVGG
jgi:O-antigen ligase